MALHSAATANGSRLSNFAPIALKMARAMAGDTLFPIILNECQIVGWKR